MYLYTIFPEIFFIEKYGSKGDQTFNLLNW